MVNGDRKEGICRLNVDGNGCEYLHILSDLETKLRNNTNPKEKIELALQGAPPSAPALSSGCLPGRSFRSIDPALRRAARGTPRERSARMSLKWTMSWVSESIHMSAVPLE